RAVDEAPPARDVEAQPSAVGAHMSDVLAAYVSAGDTASSDNGEVVPAPADGLAFDDEETAVEEPPEWTLATRLSATIARAKTNKFAVSLLLVKTAGTD